MVLIDRSSGSLRAVFDTLCANRRTLIAPSSCPASDSAILSRSGPVVEPGGNASYRHRQRPLERSQRFRRQRDRALVPRVAPAPGLHACQPGRTECHRLPTWGRAPRRCSATTASCWPARTGVMRLLSLSRLDGRGGGAPGRERLGGELQAGCPLPGGGELFTAPAVWTHGTHTTVFVAGEHGDGRLRTPERAAAPGVAELHAQYRPVLGGGLLYVYDPSRGRYRRLSPPLSTSDRAPRRGTRTLEQPGRSRRPRIGARGQRQRPRSYWDARSVFDRRINTQCFAR